MSVNGHAPRTGLVVELSGIDGSGKSTLARELAARLSARSVPCRTEKLSVFSNVAYRRYLEVLGGPYDDAPDGIAGFRAALVCLETLRFARADVLPAAAAGLVVLCDRYVESARCLTEVMGAGPSAGALRGVPAADVRLHLDIDPGEALRRRHALGERPAAAEAAYLDRMAAALALRSRDPHCVVLDATAEPPAVAEAALRAVLDALHDRERRSDGGS